MPRELVVALGGRPAVAPAPNGAVDADHEPDDARDTAAESATPSPIAPTVRA
jgi:hypothetical protein